MLNNIVPRSFVEVKSSKVCDSACLEVVSVESATGTSKELPSFRPMPVRPD